MNSLSSKLVKLLRISPSIKPASPFALGMQGNLKLFYSSGPFDNDHDNEDNNDHDLEIEDDDFLPEKPALQVQGVDPKKGWNFRGVHKAILCGKVGQAPVQKILRNGRTVTIFTIGTGGLFDQRISEAKDLPKPAQWHRIAVHNEMLGTYAVQQLAKNSSVYVEGEIETRVYNDSINGEVKNIPEVCVRRDGRIRLIKAGESISNISFEELRKFPEIFATSDIVLVGYCSAMVVMSDVTYPYSCCYRYPLKTPYYKSKPVAIATTTELARAKMNLKSLYMIESNLEMHALPKVRGCCSHAQFHFVQTWFGKMGKLISLTTARIYIIPTSMICFPIRALRSYGLA